MPTLAAVGIKNGRIVQRAGHADHVSVTAHDDGTLTLHNVEGPPPDGWIVSPDAPHGWDADGDGVRVWVDQRQPTIRFVPRLPQSDSEGRLPEMPAPDWSRVITIAEARQRRDGLRDWQPSRGQLQQRIEALEQAVQALIEETV